MFAPSTFVLKCAERSRADAIHKALDQHESSWEVFLEGLQISPGGSQACPRGLFSPWIDVASASCTDCSVVGLKYFEDYLRKAARAQQQGQAAASSGDDGDALSLNISEKVTAAQSKMVADAMQLVFSFKFQQQARQDEESEGHDADTADTDGEMPDPEEEDARQNSIDAYKMSYMQDFAASVLNVRVMAPDHQRAYEELESLSRPDAHTTPALSGLVDKMSSPKHICYRCLQNGLGDLLIKQANDVIRRRAVRDRARKQLQALQPRILESEHDLKDLPNRALADQTSIRWRESFRLFREYALSYRKLVSVSKPAHSTLLSEAYFVQVHTLLEGAGWQSIGARFASVASTWARGQSFRAQLIRLHI